MERFKTEYNCEWVVDDAHEADVRTWMAYHEAAEQVDGHWPAGHPSQIKLVGQAMSAGWYAARQLDPGGGYKRNHKAKLEALRRLGF